MGEGRVSVRVRAEPQAPHGSVACGTALGRKQTRPVSHRLGLVLGLGLGAGVGKIIFCAFTRETRPLSE